MTASQLKKSILQMAVQGKLVPQNPADEPASVLLDKIRKEKERLVREGKIKKEKVIYNDEVPNGFSNIPPGWTWCRLGEICMKIGSGSTPRGGKNVYISPGLPFLRSQNIKNNGIDLNDVVFITPEIHSKMKNTEVRGGDILLNITGASLGRCSIVPDHFPTSNVSQHVTIIRLVDKEMRSFIHLLLLSPFYQNLIWTRQVGMAREGLSKRTLEQFEILLPPLAEQKRIITKLKGIYPYLDNYEQAESSLIELNSAFPARLKKSILQAAIQGKLVPQDPTDEPASVLLAKIRAERKKLIDEGKIKKPKAESRIFRRDGSWFEKTGNVEKCIDAEIPFDIPESWEWARLGNIGYFIRGNGIKRSETVEKGTPCVRYGELYTTFDISFSKTKSFVPEDVSKNLKDVDKGDLLFTLTGENKEEIGKAVAYLGDNQLVAGGDLGIYKWHYQFPLYLAYLLNSPYCIERKALLGTGNIIVHISCDKLSTILVPIPPLNEQTRIANKVTALFSRDQALNQLLR